MILSVKHEFIYFANARTATTSLESVLGELDETAVLLPELSEFWNADPFLRTQNLKHIRPCLLEPLLDEDTWNRYFKFTFVRNPWDWCLSQYFRQYMRANKRFDPRTLRHPKGLLKFLRRRSEARRFEKFGDEEFERIWKRMKRFRGIESDENYFQSRFVVDQEGREMLDFVGHFESLEVDTRSKPTSRSITRRVPSSWSQSATHETSKCWAIEPGSRVSHHRITPRESRLPIDLSTSCRGLCVLLASVSILVSCSERPIPPQGAKNVIVLTLDGLRQDHLSAFGYSRRTSPNLDWLAENSLVFRNMVPSSCSTKASLTSLFTSLGYEDHQIIEHRAKLPDDRLTLAEVFYEAGWHTEAFVATAHLAGELNYDQGFEIYHDFASMEKRYVTADRLVGSALDSLAGRSESEDRPFFYYMHIEEPHPPWTRGSPWLIAGSEVERPFDKGCTYIPTQEQRAALTERDREDMVALYDGAIRYADVWIGALLSALRKSDLLQNTVIAVSTDHGYELLDRYAMTHGMNPGVAGSHIRHRPDGARPRRHRDPRSLSRNRPVGRSGASNLRLH